MTKVSIIIPTHNHSELLRSSISSVVDQTFKDWEIVVVDDNSNDHTYDVVSSFIDERIKCIRNEGPSIVRNLGIAAASGKYIAFLDDDDKWLPPELEKQISILDTCSEKVCGICILR